MVSKGTARVHAGAFLESLGLPRVPTFPSLESLDILRVSTIATDPSLKHVGSLLLLLLKSLEVPKVSLVPSVGRLMW